MLYNHTITLKPLILTTSITIVYAVELKTGRIISKSHDMQVMMYNLLMDEVYTKASDSNLVVYINDNSWTKRVDTDGDHLKRLMQHRNKMIYNIMYLPPSLPPSKSSKNEKIAPCSIPTPDLRNLILSNFDLNKVIQPDERRVITLASGFKIIPDKKRPKGDGFIWEMTKDITSDLHNKNSQNFSSKYTPEVSKSDKIMIRAQNTNIVFWNCTVHSIYYQVTDELGNKGKKSTEIANITGDETVSVIYLIENEKHPYINICDNAFNGKSWYQFTWDFEKEFFPGNFYSR